MAYWTQAVKYVAWSWVESLVHLLLTDLIWDFLTRILYESNRLNETTLTWIFRSHNRIEIKISTNVSRNSLKTHLNGSNRIFNLINDIALIWCHIKEYNMYQIPKRWISVKKHTKSIVKISQIIRKFSHTVASMINLTINRKTDKHLWLILLENCPFH